MQIPARGEAHHAVILRQEQHARDRATPEPAGLIRPSGLEAEQVIPGAESSERDDGRLELSPLGMRHARPVRSTPGERRCRDFLPGLTAIARTLQFHAEMAECLRSIQRVVAGIMQQHGDRIAEEARASDRPLASRPSQFEQALLRANQQNDRS
jgi:hypothetical protein